MRAAQILEPKRTRLTDLPEPELAADSVMIRVRRAGICGTDLHILHGDYSVARYPVVPGHEFSGEVVAVGDDVRHFRVGDRVAADPNLPCGRCAFCKRNEQNHCLDLRVLGVTQSGAFADYLVAPESAVFSIGSLSFLEGAMVEPLACVVWGLKRVQVQPGDSMLLFGAGPMGCLLLQAARAAGAASVTIVDPARARLQLALELGATHALTPGELTASQKELAPHGFDIVTDATGVPAVIEGCLQYLRPRGTLWVFGVAPGDAMVRISPFEVFRKDLRIVGSFALNKTFNEALALIQGGAVKVAPLVSHSLALEDFDEGLKLAEHDPSRMKVQFDLTP